jgi:LEA14-like dessication related protein
VQAFIEALRNVTMRTIKTVRILPLHGHAVEWPNVEDAITFIQAYNEEGVSLPIVRYEVQVIYINGDKISGEFAAKDAAIEFLKSYSTLPVEAQNAAI